MVKKNISAQVVTPFYVLIPAFVIVMMIFMTFLMLSVIGGRVEYKPTTHVIDQHAVSHQWFLPALMDVTFTYKTSDGSLDRSYNISLFEILYYNLEEDYMAEISAYIDSFIEDSLILDSDMLFSSMLQSCTSYRPGGLTNFFILYGSTPATSTGFASVPMAPDTRFSSVYPVNQDRCFLILFRNRGGR
ncbi:MAG: hypothetical protein ACMXYE_03650 [Candidatus Woesearchaeota archaeon]